MLIRVGRASDVAAGEITPRGLYLSRRSLLAGGAAAAAFGAGAAQARTFDVPTTVKPDPAADATTPFDKVSTYNNFYEFDPSSKTGPSELAGSLHTRPWSVVVDGEVANPRTYGIEDILRFAMEERIYRLRCVEAWSVVIPWVGFPLSALLHQVEPTAAAKYVAFQTLDDPAQMPGLKLPTLDWPYVEGLRLDEAMHRLTILAVGMYGEQLPNQDGAPVRLVVPWKYGFKSIKSIVKISLVREQPPTAWNKAQRHEYGFYSNVNPDVDHPRWSQAKERRLGEFFRRKTLPFNGYGDEVASLYTGMDLRKDF